MKEYKVVQPKIGFRNRLEKYEDFLNEYGRQGWVLKNININTGTVIFERDKNR